MKRPIAQPSRLGGLEESALAIETELAVLRDVVRALIATHPDPAFLRTAMNAFRLHSEATLEEHAFGSSRAAGTLASLKDSLGREWECWLAALPAPETR